MEGVFKAKPTVYGVGSTKDGNPNAVVNFKVLIDEKTGETRDFMWTGSLKEGRAMEITLDALLVLGYVENDLSLFAQGKGLNSTDAVQVTIENEEYNGKTFPRIKWVNAIGSGNKELMAASDAILKLGGLNIQASMMERRMKLGLTKPAMEAPPF